MNNSNSKYNKMRSFHLIKHEINIIENPIIYRCQRECKQATNLLTKNGILKYIVEAISISFLMGCDVATIGLCGYVKATVWSTAWRVPVLNRHASDEHQNVVKSLLCQSFLSIFQY